ncbi:hypothetical protein UY3_16587 [Chelonia mydas]|uniref:Uncharacterized protein n=1 Tax=Chelonia mydas TaxID=8469 RepID=M7AMA4_CHEMY|nr:hypothetical protein UY3_16587 [Chelonia mydas]
MAANSLCKSHSVYRDTALPNYIDISFTTLMKVELLYRCSTVLTLAGHGCSVYTDIIRSTCHTMASMEPVQLIAAVVSIINTLRIILEYVQNQTKRRQHEDDCDEDMDTDVPENTGCGNWDIMVAVGLVDTVER